MTEETAKHQQKVKLLVHSEYLLQILRRNGVHNQFNKNILNYFSTCGAKKLLHIKENRI